MITLKEYPLFEKEQVLTSTQLNELADYLDQQTRLTRIRLNGVGVVCGLHPSFTLNDPGTGQSTVSISAGTGVTSEGYLVNTGDADYTQYRTYTLPVTGPSYTPFIDTLSNAQVTLYEMLPASFVAPTGDPNPPSPITQTFLAGATPGEAKIAMIFVEIADMTEATCLGKNCDNGGSFHMFNQRMLLISINEARVVMQNTGVFTLDFPEKFNLPDLKVQRAIYDPSGAESRGYIPFSMKYSSAISNVFRLNLADPLGIVNVLQQTYTIFAPLLSDIYGTNPFSPFPNFSAMKDIVTGVNSVSSGPAYLGIQYFYDFIKDLILAYDEFRDAAFDFMSDCCLDTRWFPRHLFLGEAIPVDSCKPSVYRHDLIAVPMTPDQRVAKDRLLTYFARMVLMARKLDTALVHNPNMAAPPLTRITPSLEKIEPLSKRSIPYYYKLDENDAQLNTTLEAVWNYDLVRRCKKDSLGQFPVVAYGNQAINQNSPIDPIKTPYRFDKDWATFHRIEGHLRKRYLDVLSDLETQKVEFNLGFNVTAVRLEGARTRDEAIDSCNFDNLNAQYLAYRNALACRSSNLVKHYMGQGAADSGGRGADGGTPLQPLPNFVLQLIFDSETGGHGNSSVDFLPTVFDPPGSALPLAHRGPLTYAPRSISAVKTALDAAKTALINRFLTISHNNLLPQDLRDFDYGFTQPQINLSFINSYLDAVQTACSIKALYNELLDHIWHATTNTFTPEMYFTLSLWAQEEFYLLNEFILDCTYRELEAVYYTFQYYVNYLTDLRTDPTLFANFIANNPGAEHLAGVRDGNTFVLVYPGRSLHFDVKTRDVIAAQAQEVKFLQVEFETLAALPVKNEEQSARMAVVQNRLCTLYAQEAAPRPRPRTLGIQLPSLVLQQINIDADQVIADFTLPYLSNCNCDCASIPTPTTEQLGLPDVIKPDFFEYHLGDYAFAKDIDTMTYGCTTITPLLIDVSKHINYLGTRVGSGSIVRLKFVVNGADTPAVAAAQPSPSSIQTEKGGSVSITQGNGVVQSFYYIPPRNFSGLDTFRYVFEVYDGTGNVMRRSTVATVFISVTSRCPATKAAATTSGGEILL